MTESNHIIMKKIATNPKLIVITGPTSSGKTDYSIKLAKKINGEIVSADSRQVYKGINLLSGKVTKKEMSGIKHYMLDVATPKKAYSVSDFKKQAEKAIDEIIEKGKTPILCGGTGFYIDAVVYNRTMPEVGPNPKLRKSLEKLSKDELYKMLYKLDRARAKTIDRDNPVRLIRAIEIAKALGKVPKFKTSKSKYEVEWILIDQNDDVLKQKIHDRLHARVKQGMLREAKKLHDSGVSYKRMEDLGLECRFASLYLQKKITKNEMLTQLEKEIWQYVKRQRTWFRSRQKSNHVTYSKAK